MKLNEYSDDPEYPDYLWVCPTCGLEEWGWYALAHECPPAEDEYPAEAEDEYLQEQAEAMWLNED